VKRTPEPELMVDAESVDAYAAADFEEPHSRFLALLFEKLPALPDSGRAVDLGCGPADIAIRFARVFPGWSIDAVDGSGPMLEAAGRAVARAGLSGRIALHRVLLPGDPPSPCRYDLVFSNSLLHHLDDPVTLWRTISSWGRDGGFVFVMDLLRPEDEAGARALVERYAADEPETLRRDFHHSLLAAYRDDEVRAQLRVAGLATLRTSVVSDRHWIAFGALR
jgi:SAM-dependent methyltransferase